MILNDFVLQNTGSEPRDVLMSERTALSWLKFALTLTITAISLITNFRFPDFTDPSNGDDDGSFRDHDPHSMAIAIVFIALSFGCILFGALGYFQMVKGYNLHKVSVFKFEYSMFYLMIMCVTLLGINGGLIYNMK